MKDKIGVVRKIDKLGRIVIPKEMRDCLHIGENTEISFMIRNDYITLKPVTEIKHCTCGHIIDATDNYCSKCGLIQNL